MEITDIRFDNIRGFRNAEVGLDNENYVFVGSNNSGKTSVLIILDWFFNSLTRGYLESNLEMPKEWDSMLLPARETRNQARRITLSVKISDGRKARKYKAALNSKGDRFLLRVNMRLSPKKVVVRLGYPIKGEDFESEYRAIDLVSELQENFYYHYISSFRGHSGERLGSLFSDTFSNHLNTKLESLNGNHRDKKSFATLQKNIKRLTSKEFEPLINDIFESLPAAMTPSFQLSPEVDQRVFVEFISKIAEVNISTGNHDLFHVSPDKVGAGLRSALELAIQVNNRAERKSIIAIDEPEAFLHPSAQRLLAKKLYSLDIHKTLFSTHSSIMVEESDLTSVVITKSQKFFPASVSGDVRKEISLALLKKHGAELVFSRSVLLVEGESDYFFFETLRERLLKLDVKGLLADLYVLPVGGKQQFCPYVQLIDCFGENEHPISWLIVADGDTTSEIKKISRTLNIAYPSEVSEKVKEVEQKFSNGEIEEWLAATSSLNSIFSKLSNRIFLIPGDLETVILEKASDSLLENTSQVLGLDEGAAKGDILQKMGSKSANGGQVINKPNKAPYVRAGIARKMSGNEINENLRKILYMWASPAGADRKYIDSLVNKLL